MRSLGRLSFGTALLAARLHQLAAAQIPAVVQGRIEDAVTRAPLVEARISSPDSSVVVLTDSTGAFSIEVADQSAISLLVERFGYVTDRFELAADAAYRVTVLVLEPEPLELGALDVEAQAALDQVLTQLERRRNIYPYGVRTYDGGDIAESTAFGSAWEFLKGRLPKIYECAVSISGLCVGDPPYGFTVEPPDDPDVQPASGPPPPLGVCIDGHETVQAIEELRTIPIEDVGLLEIYRNGRGGVRVYTADYLFFAARMGGIYIAPTHTWSQPGRMFSGRC